MRKGAYVAAEVTATTMSFMLQHHGQLSLEVRGVERLMVLGPACAAGAGQEEQHVGAPAGSCLPTPAACSRAQPCVDVHARVCTYVDLSSWYFGDGDSSRAVVWVGCAESHHEPQVMESRGDALRPFIPSSRPCRLCLRAGRGAAPAGGGYFG